MNTVQMKVPMIDGKVIAEQLRIMGVKPALAGYGYLKEALSKCYADASYKKDVVKRLYVEIAKQFNTTASRVERAIRHAIEVAWSLGNADLQNKVFGYTVSLNRGKPTNSEFIATMSEYLHEISDYA